MSVCAVMLVKDEADIIGYTLNHLFGQVDEVIVADNLSQDGTREILDDYAGQHPQLVVIDDPDVGYWQSKKTTELSLMAADRGHAWVLPCDADEFWYFPLEGANIREFLGGQAPDVGLVNAELFHHVPTARDNSGERNPFIRQAWRLREKAALPKVCVRPGADVTIEAGNHGATIEHRHLRIWGLVVRHFSWRSEQQYARKIKNGARAYAATDLPEGIGRHWRGWGDPDDPDLYQRAAAHYREWFYWEDPAADKQLILDPCPVNL